MDRWLIGLLLLAVVGATHARIPRDRSEVRAFRHTNACPATGLHHGRCDGWEVDHIKSLCSGGPDRRENMQWIPKHDHKLKSFLDTKECREARTSPH